MNLREDITLSVRAMLGSSLESLLLTIGLALSIGATAAGIAMYEQALSEASDVLQQAQYREIVINPREGGNNMTQAVIAQSNENISLSINDLSAAETAPAVAYAYITSSTRLRFNNAANSNFGGGPEAAEQTRTQPNENNRNADNGQAGGNPNAGNPTTANAPGAEQRGNGQRPEGGDNATANNNRENQQRTDFEFASVENGPIPLLNEVPAYQVSGDYFPALELTAAQGSVFTQQDLLNNSKVLVVGSEIAKTLFEDGEVMNRQVASFDSIYTIIGVLAETDSALDSAAFLPSALAGGGTGAQAARGPGGTRNLNLHFTVNDASQLDAAAQQLDNWFKATYNGASVNINIPRENAQAALARSEKIALITLVLALAGLLIASVNVSNILYGRTLRRRKQIGILKALGASNRKIFNLFFNESLVLIVLGSLLGLLIVFGFSSLIVSVTGGGSLNILAVLIGVLLASSVTLGFTLIPAVQATKIPAAEAFRTE